MTSRFLVAPPGTGIGEPGWREPWPGLTLSWGVNGESPPLAVQCDGVLLSTGLPPPAPAASCREPGGTRRETPATGRLPFWLRLAGLPRE